MSKNRKLTLVMIVLLNFIPNAYLCSFFINAFDELASDNDAAKLMMHAEKIESGIEKYSAERVASHYKNLSKASQLTSDGYKHFKVAMLVWLVYIVACLAINIILLVPYLHKKKNT